MPGRVLAVHVGTIPTGPRALTGSLSESLSLVDSASGVLVAGGGTVEPTAANTGPAAGVSLTTHSGDLVLNDGDNVSRLHVTGDLALSGSDCSATDILVDGGVYFATTAGFGPSTGSRQTVTRVKANLGLWCIGGFQDVAVYSSWFGADGVNNTTSQLVDSSTRTASGFICRDSYFYGRPDFNGWLAEHPNDPNNDPHWEAAHWAGVVGFDVTNTVFDIQPKNGPSDSTSMGHITAAMTFENSWATTTQCSGNFSGNHLYGGGAYQIYLNLVGGSTFNDNAFHSDTGSTPYTIAIANPSFTASGNTLDGAPYAVTT